MPSAHGTPAVALASLRIKNFRGIESLDLDFRGPDGLPNRLVVLAGPNGSGKSSVLEAGLILAGGSRLAVGHRGKKAIGKNAEDYHIKGDFKKQFELSREWNPETYTMECSAFLDAPQQNPPIRHWYFSSWRSPILVGSVDVSVGKSGRRPAKTDKNRLWNVKRQLANLAALGHFPRKRRAVGLSYESVIQAINESWRDFYPRSNDSPNSNDEFFVGVTLGEDVEAENGAFDVFLGDPEGSYLQVDCLSAGQIELFLFIASLALNDQKEGIVFIDEPELHLDPQWHRPILRTLMKLQPKAQFIVATHSPEIYDAAQSYERHFLVDESDPRARPWNVSPKIEAEV